MNVNNTARARGGSRRRCRRRPRRVALTKSGAPRPQPRYLYSRCLTPWGLFWRERWRPEIVSQGAITPMGRQSATVFASLSFVGRMHTSCVRVLVLQSEVSQPESRGGVFQDCKSCTSALYSLSSTKHPAKTVSNVLVTQGPKGEAHTALTATILEANLGTLRSHTVRFPCAPTLAPKQN